jgi:hypothetical protein
MILTWFSPIVIDSIRRLAELDCRVTLGTFVTLFRDHEKTLRQSVILVFLYLTSMRLKQLPIDDPDIWRHLRTGQ